MDANEDRKWHVGIRKKGCSPTDKTNVGNIEVMKMQQRLNLNVRAIEGLLVPYFITNFFQRIV